MYQPGRTNAADALSRLPLKYEAKRNLGEEYVYFVAKMATPKALTTEEIEERSACDEILCKVRKAIRTGNWSELPEYKFIKDELSSIGKLILRGRRIMIPEVLKEQVLAVAHEGHQGIVKCKQRLREKVWWLGIDKQVEISVKRCQACQLMSPQNKPEPLLPTKLPEGPWQHIGIDLCGPFPGGETLLVAVDYYSRWFEIGVLYSTTTSKIIEVLDSWFTCHGLPELIVSDNGTQFKSNDFKEFLEQNGVKHRKVTPYSPQANGEVERQNKTLLKAIRSMQVEGKNWKKEINKFLLAYRSTSHCVTGVSPAELMYGRKLRTKLPVLSLESNVCDEQVRDRDKCYKGKDYYDKIHHAKVTDVDVGDIVVL